MTARIVDLYFNSGQYTRTLPYLIGMGKDAFAFFSALAEYCREHDVPAVSDSRILRYEVLRDFALSGEMPGGRPDRDELIENLSVDLYLREKLKHRPDWVHDLSDRYTFNYMKRDPFTYNAEATGK